jgi:hypothetical protein
LSDARELIIENVGVTRTAASVSFQVNLKGRFWNETDQNLYIFVGRILPDGTQASYALSSDEQYFADLPYQVRSAISLPHSNDIRIGIMAPREAAYTPQIYINDAVHTDFVGREAHIRMELNEHSLRLELPLAEYYERKQMVVPERVSFTLATARDYVGFVDQISVMDVAAGETKNADQKRLAPTLYPTLNYDSHLFKSVTLEESGNSVKVVFEMSAEIQDWAQTNLHFYFVPYPPATAPASLYDPSKTIAMPAPWSFYCGVYSPTRVFCKASNGTDFIYDKGYAERAELAQPTGAQFRVLGTAKYALELTPAAVAKIKADRGAFALLLMAGRDGFGPTSIYGWSLSKRCNLTRRLLGVAIPSFMPPLVCP